MGPSANHRPFPCTDPAYLLNGLAEYLLDHKSLPATVIGVSGGSAQHGAVDVVELALANLGNDHPEQLLLGFQAPPHWWALGAITPAEMHSRRGTATCRVAAFAWSGGVAARLAAKPAGRATVDGDAGEATAAVEPEGGWLADLLRLGLGLATGPCQVPVANLVTALWFDALLRFLAGGAAPLSWPDMAARHPLAAVIGLDDVSCMAPACFGQAAAEASRSLGDGGLRTLAISGGLTANGVTAPLADWFDDGSFARWLARQLPPLSALLPHLCDILSPRAGAALRTATRQCTDTVRPVIR